MTHAQDTAHMTVRMGEGELEVKEGPAAPRGASTAKTFTDLLKDTTTALAKMTSNKVIPPAVKDFLCADELPHPR